jgi:hypothetical protein
MNMGQIFFKVYKDLAKEKLCKTKVYKLVVTKNLIDTFHDDFFSVTSHWTMTSMWIHCD